MKGRSARSGIAAVAVAVALGTGGLAYGASVVAGGSTADTTPPEGTHGPAHGGTADITPPEGDHGQAPASGDSTADLAPPAGANSVPDGSGDVDTSDRGVKGVAPTEDRGDHDAPVSTE